ncbi:Uncharacterised protein [Mycobacterium tuberculosis]|nr:Uncharacterised protein [Mycobacterium tuberculosis]
MTSAETTITAYSTHVVCGFPAISWKPLPRSIRATAAATDTPVNTSHTAAHAPTRMRSMTSGEITSGPRRYAEYLLTISSSFAVHRWSSMRAPFRRSW